MRKGKLNMKLSIYNHYLKNEYICDLTKELDSLSGLDKNKDNYKLGFHHYVLADDWCKDHKCLAIRVPGGTLGGIFIDDKNEITSITLDTNYVVQTYPEDVHEHIKKFIGMTIEF